MVCGMAFWVMTHGGGVGYWSAVRVVVGARERMLVVVNIWGCLIVVIGFVI